MADRMMNFHSSILQVASIIKNKEQRKTKENTDVKYKKRDRQANYSKQETDMLVELILLKKDILENKKNTAVRWHEKKEAWEDIEREFNKRPVGDAIYRDSKTLRIKYESLKKDIRRKWKNILNNKKNHNGKLPKFSAAENKIKEMLSLPMDGFCDFDSIDDINDNKSDDDVVSNSSMSDSCIEELDCTNVKKERAISDDETTDFASYNDNTIGTSTKMREDPLVGLLNNQRHAKNNNDVLENRVEVSDLEQEQLKMKLQTDMLKEELEIKKLQRKMLEQELEHKKIMHELEKEHLLLKIQAQKNDNHLVQLS